MSDKNKKLNPADELVEASKDYEDRLFAARSAVTELSDVGHISAATAALLIGAVDLMLVQEGIMPPGEEMTEERLFGHSD